MPSTWARTSSTASSTCKSARIEVEEFEWQRVLVDGKEHDHTWVRKGQETRTAAVTVTGSRR